MHSIQVHYRTEWSWRKYPIALTNSNLKTSVRHSGHAFKAIKLVWKEYELDRKTVDKKMKIHARNAERYSEVLEKIEQRRLVCLMLALIILAGTYCLMRLIRHIQSNCGNIKSELEVQKQKWSPGSQEVCDTTVAVGTGGCKFPTSRYRVQSEGVIKREFSLLKNIDCFVARGKYMCDREQVTTQLCSTWRDWRLF